MSAVVIKLNRTAVRNLLQGHGDPRLSEDVTKRCDAVAQKATELAAEAGFPEAEFVTDVEVGRNRLHGRVITANAEAMVAEASHRVLTQAFDAGR